VLLEIEIVSVGAIDPPNLVDIAKTLGDDERGASPGALEDRIDRNRRAVKKEPRRGIVGARLFDACRDAFDQVMRGRERLAERELAAVLVEDRDVGERSPDIGRQSNPSPTRPVTLCHWPPCNSLCRDLAWCARTSTPRHDVRETQLCARRFHRYNHRHR